MTKDELHRYIEESKGNENNICQICAYKDGQMVYSDTWHDYKKDDCVHIMSATKSVMSLLIGIALDKGQIATSDPSSILALSGLQYNPQGKAHMLKWSRLC